MDAKPQRPLRAIKIRDENMIPTALPAKTIHQRNKSSPALSTLAQTGTLKMAAKRTAFADVSNTIRGSMTVKDDSALVVKSSIQPLKALQPLKDVNGQENTRATTLLRPAQRPLSVAGVKGFFNSLASGTSSNMVKSVIPEVRQETTVPSANIKKPLVRKATTIFKEVEPIVREYSVGNAVAGDPLGAIGLGITAPQPLLPTQHEVSSAASNGLQQLASSYAPKPTVLPELQEALQVEQQRRAIEAAYLPSKDRQGSFLASEIYVDAPTHIALETTQSRGAEARTITTIVEAEECVPHVPLESPQEFEPQGLYDEEYYDDQYDEDGYTTARSLKSRGEYTTGPTTVLLAPRITAKVEQELVAARNYVESSRTAHEIEEDESWDTSMVAEYGDEIFGYMRVLEEQMRPNPFYMDNQTEVQWSMRSVLMDWIVQVHHRFSLLPETLFLTVNYIDRFLSCKVVSLGKLQLVGATAIFVAAKYEEINCPSVQEIVYMVDGGYTADEILKAERFMLSMLQFELGWPGPMSFLRRVSKADDYDLETRMLAKYFLEITIMDERFVGSIPSFTAAGAHCLARLMLKKGSWSQAHVYYSQYTYSQLRPLLVAMLSCCEDPQKHHAAVFDKYGDKRFKRASFYVQSEMAKGFVLPPMARSSNASYIDFTRDYRPKEINV